MTIQEGDFIKLSYNGKLEDGIVFDTTDENVAKENGIYNEQGMYGGDVVVAGAGHTIKGLDEELIGKEEGDSGTIEIPPEKAFGEHDPKLVESHSITKFQDRKAYPGMEVQIDNRKGVVSRVIGRRVRVDFNHPLAGKTVTYDYSIDKKIEDDDEKLQGLLALYTGMPEMDAKIENNTAIINIPNELTFNQRWLMVKGRIASELMQHLGIEEVQYVEKYPPESSKTEESESEETMEETESSGE
ncbi:peptidylprolyl isomerase FKBP-type [Methanohalobium evestigatum Z-7303]|uniref:Peptidyl-prolyl cis-trans isomerase n=1 Tax=Methanohalobium evestigatum (strain ATCC BAA-1072 / DSM 3721 / NBRC 107634 / OCM 161 / Z-7303) TaxID=644295 RepID=D7EAT7_METEZ|nr:peptidylprolyl isomerase [Methanohalobium evestigatum]ADI74454.1 peptidylprolyl isomerase FKBP-type [Methanohalobium evestigatum Z-7303]